MYKYCSVFVPLIFIFSVLLSVAWICLCWYIYVSDSLPRKIKSLNHSFKSEFVSGDRITGAWVVLVLTIQAEALGEVGSSHTAARLFGKMTRRFRVKNFDATCCSGCLPTCTSRSLRLLSAITRSNHAHWFGSPAIGGKKLLLHVIPLLPLDRRNLS